LGHIGGFNGGGDVKVSVNVKFSEWLMDVVFRLSIMRCGLGGGEAWCICVGLLRGLVDCWLLAWVVGVKRRLC